MKTAYQLRQQACIIKRKIDKSLLKLPLNLMLLKLQSIKRIGELDIDIMLYDNDVQTDIVTDKVEQYRATIQQLKLIKEFTNLNI